jgi:PAS domain S-box-containing protein
MSTADSAADARDGLPRRRAAAEDAADISDYDSHELLRCQNQVLELVARDAPLHQTLDLLARAIEQLTPDMFGSILLLDPDGVHVRHGAAPSLPDAYMRAIDGEAIGPQAGSCGTAAYRGEPVIVEDIATDPLWEPYRQTALAFGLRACWSTPIFDGQQRVLGTFALYYGTPRSPTSRHLHLIDVTTYTAAIAIVHHREREDGRRREAQFAEAERIAHLGSYEWDAHTNQTRRSAELCRLFGLTPSTFPATFEAYLARVHPDDREATRQLIETSMSGRTPFAFEERIVRPDGSVRLLRSQGTWIGNESDRTVRLVGVCQDVTDQRHADEEFRRNELLRGRNEELKAFAYMVSHDLKAPLRGIAGYARELAHDHQATLSPRGAHCVEEIVAATRSLDALIEDLLRYSRLDAIAPTIADVELAPLVDEILRSRHAVITERRAIVSLSLTADRVRTWERGLVQMLTNLIDNALKYSRDSARPTIRIESERHGGGIRIAVADNGIGFDMAHHDRIFALFNRLVGPDSYEGTGAGLAIVKKISDKIGARVWATSAPGAGATFYIDIPSQAA